MDELSSDSESITVDPTADERSLARLEALANIAVARAAPVRFRVAGSAQEREEVYRLRYRVVVSEGWALPSDLPNGLERDPDDDRAVLLGGWDGSTLVATLRLVFPAPGQRLPVETLYGIDVEPRGRVVHLDRIIVARSHSDPRSRVLLGLVARGWLEMRRFGYHICAGTDSPATIRHYRRLGFTVTVLGPARQYWKEERFPVRFDPAAVSDQLSGRYATTQEPPEPRP